jgi:hypothetical protein
MLPQPGTLGDHLLQEGTTMPDTDHPSPVRPAPDSPADWIMAIAASLTAVGLTATTDGDHVTGLAATVAIQHPGRARAEVQIDEDGYAELRWSASLAAPPPDIAAIITRVMTAVTTTPAALAPEPAQP